MSSGDWNKDRGLRHGVSVHSCCCSSMPQAGNLYNENKFIPYSWEDWEVQHQGVSVCEAILLLSHPSVRGGRAKAYHKDLAFITNFLPKAFYQHRSIYKDSNHHLKVLPFNVVALRITFPSWYWGPAYSTTHLDLKQVT